MCRLMFFLKFSIGSYKTFANKIKCLRILKPHINKSLKKQLNYRFAKIEYELISVNKLWLTKLIVSSSPWPLISKNMSQVENSVSAFAGAHLILQSYSTCTISKLTASINSSTCLQMIQLEITVCIEESFNPILSANSKIRNPFFVLVLKCKIVFAEMHCQNSYFIKCVRYNIYR